MPSREEKEALEDRQNAPRVHEPLSGLDDNQPLAAPSVERGSTVPSVDEIMESLFDRPEVQDFREQLDFRDDTAFTLNTLRAWGAAISPFTTASPTAGDPKSIQQSVNTVDRAIEFISLTNPPMASYLPQQAEPMLLLPEVTAAVQDEQMGPTLIEALYGEDFETQDPSTVNNPFHLEVLEAIGPRLSPEANVAVMRSMQALKGTGRFEDSYMANVIGYLETNDMSKEGAMDSFVVFQAMQAFTKQQEFFSEASFIGRIGENISQPFRVTSDWATHGWNKVASPQDAWWRNELSIGQTSAISWNQDVGSAGYQKMSGVTDGVANIVIDPISIAANLAIGFKAVKGAAVLSQMSRTRMLATAFIPFYGKRAFERMGIRPSTRFIANRVGMVFGSRTTEQLTTSKKARALWKVLSEVNSSGIIIERIPEWKNAGKLVDAVAGSNDPKQIERLVQQAMHGAFDGNDELHQVARLDVDNAMANLDVQLRAGLADANPVKPTATADGTSIIFDGPTRKATLERAAKFVDEGVEGTHKGDMVLGDGRAATYTSGITPGGEKWTIVKVGDEIVSARIGEMAGTHADFGRQGLYTQILEQQKQELGLTIDELQQGGSISEAATPVMNRVFGGDDVGIGQVDGIGGYTSTRGVWDESGKASLIDQSGTSKVILHKDAKVLDMSANDTDKIWDALIKYLDENFPGSRAAGEKPTVKFGQDEIDSYLNAMGYDAVIQADGSIRILKEDKVLRGMDTNAPRSVRVEAAFMDHSNKQSAANKLNDGNRASTWIVDEMPTGKFPDNVDDFNTVRPGKWSGASSSKHWWVRAVKSRVFGKYPPSKISTTDVVQGQLDLQNFLRYVGVHTDDVQRIVRAYADTAFIARHRFVRDAVQEAAELIDNPIIKYNLIEYVNRGANSSYGKINGVEALTTQSSVDISQQVSRPFIPSMLSNGVDLPDPQAFAKAHQRYKVASNMGPAWRRGITSATKEKRKTLVGNVRRKLKAQFGDSYMDEFTDTEIESMAYSVVGRTDGGSDGLGAVAHAGGAVNKAWSWGVQAFSIVQLAGRFMPWYSRVWLDENFRAAFADLPTIMRNPQRYLSTWRDAHALRRAGIYRADAITWVEETVKGFDGITGVGELRNAARRVITNIDELEPEAWTTVAQGQRRIASILNEHAIKNDYGQIIGGVSGRKQRVYQRAIDLADDMGMDATKPGFDFKKEIPDIANQGFSKRFGLGHASRPVDWTPNVTEAGEIDFAAKYHQNLTLFTRDPLIRHAMASLADDMGGARNTRNPLSVLESNGYKRIEPYVQQWAAEAGFGELDRVALLDRYVELVLKPFVRETYGTMYGDDAVEGARVLGNLAESGKVEINVGGEVVKLNFDGGSEGASATDALIALAKLPEFPNSPPPRTINANMTHFGIMDEPTGDWVDAAKRMPSRIMRFWGERMTQTGMRQPAYLSIFAKEKKARVALGMSDKAATELAHITASEIVNNIYFNTKAVTPFLKSMNNVIPFFTAAWEIASTWGYKIPMLQGGMGIGHVAVIRKIDRVMDALRELGLVEFSEEGQPRLNLDSKPMAMPGPGDEISRAGALILQQPLRVVSHLMNLGHALQNSNVDRDSDPVPDKFSFAISSPVDIQSQGIGTAFDLVLGAQPGLALGLGKVREKLPFVSKTKTVTTTGTFAEFAEENDVDVFRTIALNMSVLEAHLGNDVLVQLLKGQIGPEMVDLDGVDLVVPNSSVAATLWSDILTPYGDTESLSDVASNYKPSWLDYVWRAFGIWKDGEPADGFVSINNFDLTDSANSGAIIAAARHMNFETGVFDEVTRYREEFYALAAPYLDAGQMEMKGNELLVNGVKPDNFEEVNDAWVKLTMYSDAAWVRAIEDGASMLAMRGMLGIFLPGTPRLHFEEEKALDAFYAGRNTDDPLRKTDIVDTLNYIKLWMSDPAGSSAINAFMKANPTMGPYLVGKTYWGIGGVPPLERDDDEAYFRDLREGLIKPMPHGAWRVRTEIKDNEYNRQIAIVEAYGNDPWSVAAMTLADPQAYNAISQPFTQRHHMYMWEDELRGGEYARYKNRNAEDQFSIREEAIGKFNDFSSTLSDTIAMLEVTPLLNVSERKETINTLKAMKAGISEFADEMKVGDQEYDFLAPWQQLRIRWFDEVYVPYLDMLGAEFDKFDDSNTSTQDDRIWAEIARLESGPGSATTYIDGQAFPPPNVFKWNNKEDEVKEADTLKSITYKAPWLDTRQIDRIVEVSPEMEKYLPTTPAQRGVWQEYNEWYDLIDERFANGTGDISANERDKQRGDLDKQLRVLLQEEGLTDQIVYLDMWDIQKLNLAGSLPSLFQDSTWIHMVNGMQQRRAADGFKSIGVDDQSRRALTRQLLAEVETNPQFRDELVELGIQLYGEDLPMTIIPKLFFNDKF